jgi:hypothetical protein
LKLRFIGIRCGDLMDREVKIDLFSWSFGGIGEVDLRKDMGD